jgi:hypothetical protein
VAEFKNFTVTLRGQELTAPYGHNMRLVRARYEAGTEPEVVDLEHPTQDENIARQVWLSDFVRYYYQLTPQFMLDVDPAEIVAAVNAIGEAAQRDPFGQLPEAKIPAPPPPPPNIQVGDTKIPPTTGS